MEEADIMGWLADLPGDASDALEDLGFVDSERALPLARWKTGRRFGPLRVWPTGGQRTAWQLSLNARAALNGWAAAKKLT
eukprot:5528038-Alexandrium_andersonii.AAC.1